MRFQKTILSILLGSLLPSTIFAFVDNTFKIESSLQNFFTNDRNATKNIIVEFKDKASSVLGRFNFSEISTEEEVTEFARKFKFELKTLSMNSQQSVLAHLKNCTNDWEMFWVSNQLFVEGASNELVNAIGDSPNVALVREEKMFNILKPMELNHVTLGRKGGNVLDDNDGVKNIEWNIQKIHADQIWSKVRANLASNDSGPVVGVIDTGVHCTHEAFPARTVIAWMDAINQQSEPYDDNGHGTHVTGTICGQNGIGVAPGIKIVSCKACTRTGSCPEAALTRCAQFMTDQTPHVVSNSWGGPSGAADYADVINGWKALGIFSVFAAGNAGPGCQTIGSPADYPNVGLSVGATTMSDELAGFSSRGPQKNGLVGPGVSAPGEGIKSAWPTENNAYRELSGTSMATPHVAGLYALLYSMNPQITFDQARAAIVNSCTTNGLPNPQETCGETAFSQFPNNMYGNGLIDCVRATEVLSKVNANGLLL